MASPPYPRALERFPTLGQSRLATFDRCALSSSFEENFRRNWTGHPQARGQVFHRFAAECLRVMSVTQEAIIPQDVALAILQDCLRQTDVDRECHKCHKPILRRAGGKCYCAEGHETASGFVNLPMSEIKDLRWVAIKWATDNAFDIANLVDIETMVETAVAYPDPAGGAVVRRVRGKIDAWFITGVNDDEAVVLDWKDTWALPGPTDVGFDGYFQQRFYALLIFDNYPQIQKVTLREEYVRFSEPREAVVWRYQIEDIRAEISAIAERFDRAFEESNFPASPGAHCQFCPRPAACPINPAVRGAGAIMDEETARVYASEANVARSALKQRTDALKAWATVHGHIPISDHKGKRVWGFRATTRIARPSRKDIEAALRLNGGHPLTQADLDRLFTETGTTRFEPHAPQPIEDTADDAVLISAALEASLALGGDGE